MSAPPTPMNLAVVQTNPVFLNKKQTVEKACDLISQAGRYGAQLVVFPEAFVSGYPDWVWVVPNSKGAILNDLYTELVDNAISIPDESTDQLCKAAKSAKVHVAIGINERNTEASNQSLYNTLLWISDEGEILGKHRKLVPTGGERLVWSQGDGSTFRVFDTPIGRLGGLICWENYMPLARNAMYAWGAQVLLAPTWDKSPNWISSLQHIAREGGLFVVGCCMSLQIDDIPDRYDFKSLYPEGREWINVGNSCVIDPKGQFLAGPVEMKKEILHAELDFKQITAAKRMLDVTGHYSRPDVFKFSVNQEPNPMI